MVVADLVHAVTDSHPERLSPVVDVSLGAMWREPLGERSSIAELQDHPVVHIAYADAEAYASLHDMIGNVWEWTCDGLRSPHRM